MDLAACVKLLRKIGKFSTSDEHNRGGSNCKDKNHVKNQKCCTDCDHKCSKCEKEKCDKDKCCLTSTKSSHECQGCGTDAYECTKNKYVCCTVCGTCLFCLLNAQGIENRDDLYEKLIQQKTVGICEEQELRLSLHIILAFRNMTMHSTEVEYDNMDNNNFSCDQLPAYCSSWEMVRDTICHATETVLKYLEKNDPKFTNRQLMKQQQDLSNVESMTTEEEVLDIYRAQINKFLKTEQLLEVTKGMEELSVKMDELSLKSLDIMVKYIFKDPNEFDLHSKMADEIERHFKESWENHPESNGFDIIMNGIHSESKTQRDSSGLDSIVLKFEVEQSQTHPFPKAFKNGRSDLSKELWNYMKATVQAKLPNVDSIKLMNWKLGSIIIYMKLCKKFGEVWSTEEICQVQSMLPAITQEVMEEFQGYICKCKITDTDDSDKDENIITFRFEAKDKWGARFLETLKPKPNIELQRFLTFNNPCKCRDSYCK